MTRTTTIHFVRTHRRLALLIMALMMLAGCGEPRGVVFEPLETPLRWPDPPAPARIKYVGALSISSDLKPGKSMFQGMSEAIFGADESRSMLSPYAICSDDADRIFICDSNGQIIHVFDLEQREYQRWKPEKEATAFAQPVGIALDWLGRLLVVDSVASTIFVFDTNGALLGEWAGEHVLRPCGIAVDHERERVYIVDAALHQVLVLAGDGELIDRIGTRGTAPGTFNYPTCIAVDRQGRIYVSDSLNFRVQVFDVDYAPLKIIGSKGDLPGYFSQPKGVALDSEDHLYVVDAHFEAVQVFDDEGRLLLTFGEEGHDAGQFWLPAGIHVDRQDRIWVADPYNRRVQVFEYVSEIAP